MDTSLDSNLHTVFLEPFCDQERQQLQQFMELSYTIAQVLGITVEELFTRGMNLLQKALQAKQEGRAVSVAGLSEDGRETLKIHEIIRV
jgi:DNA-binding XRE family transcriptional regulator